MSEEFDLRSREVRRISSKDAVPAPSGTPGAPRALAPPSSDGFSTVSRAMEGRFERDFVSTELSARRIFWDRSRLPPRRPKRRKSAKTRGRDFLERRGLCTSNVCPWVANKNPRSHALHLFSNLGASLHLFLHLPDSPVVLKTHLATPFQCRGWRGPL